MTAYSYGTTPQQRLWMYEKIGKFLWDQDQKTALMQRLFGRQQTPEFLPVSVSPVPHQLRLQHHHHRRLAMTDHFHRIYHPWPSEEHESLRAPGFRTNRFFVAISVRQQSALAAISSPTEAQQASTQMPAVGELVDVSRVGDTAITRTRVLELQDVRTASAIAVLDSIFWFDVEPMELVIFFDSQIAEQ